MMMTSDTTWFDEDNLTSNGKA